MDNKFEVQLANGDILHVKKDWLGGYRIYEPPSRWFHYIIGTKKNAITLFFIMLIAVGLYFGINELIGAYKAIALDPCTYCKVQVPKLNISNLTSIG